MSLDFNRLEQVLAEAAAKADPVQRAAFLDRRAGGIGKCVRRWNVCCQPTSKPAISLKHRYNGLRRWLGIV